MLFYFSATGNTRHVAEKIKEPQEEMISIEEACKAESYEYTVKDGRFGILSPTYDWGLPSIVYEFLEKLKLRYETKPYSFYVGTFGTARRPTLMDNIRIKNMQERRACKLFFVL